MNRLSQKTSYTLMIFITIIGFGLRFAYLDRSMRFDEAQTVFVYVTKSIPSIFADYSAPNNHIFHNVLVHLVFHYLGESPMFVRLPSFIAGLLIIPMSFVVGTRFYNKPTGLISASLVAVAPILIDFSVNARGYTIITFITLMLFYLGHSLQYKDNTQGWLLISVLSALGFLTIPVMLYPMGIFALWLLMSILRHNSGTKRTELLKNYVVSMVLGAVLTLVLYTPAIYLSGLDRLVNNVNIQAMSVNEYYRHFPNVLGRMWLHISWKVPPILLIPLIASFIISTLFHKKVSNNTLLLLPFILGWILPLLLIQRVDPFPRVWHFLVPLLAIISASGIYYLVQKLNVAQFHIVVGTMVLIMIGMSTYIIRSDIITTSTFTLRVPDAEQAAFTLNDIMTPNDQILMRIPSNYTVFYYSLINGFPLGNGTRNPEESNSGTQDNTPSYLYIFYHTGGNADIGELPDLYAAFPDEIDNSEVLYEWDFSIMRRLLLEDR